MQPQHQMYPVRQDPGLHSKKLTAPQPQGPMAQDHQMTTETQDADLIFPQALLINIREVPSYYDSHVNSTMLELRNGSILWETSNIPADNKLVTIHCKAGSMSVRLVFETRAKCQDFVARYKDDGIPYEIESPFCSVKTNIAVRQSKSLEDREIGKQFAPLWRELAEQLKVLFPEGDDEGAFIVPALDARSQVLSIKDRRNGIGKPVFKLTPFGSGQLFTLVAPDLRVPGIPDDVLQQVISQASTATV